MSGQSECKGCFESVGISTEEIDRVFGESVKVKNVKLVSTELYNERLKICQKCENLLYGTTCRYCGCLVRLNAKLAVSSCQCPENPRW